MRHSAPQQFWVGIEHEFLCHDEHGRRVDFRTVIGGTEVGAPNLVPTDPNARWLYTGTILTADKKEAELATPPAPLEPGFAGRVDGWARHERAELAAQLPSLRLTGDSTHINVTLPDDVDPDEIADLFASRFAAGQMLLMDRRASPGLLIRPRPHRLEIGGEYAVGSALRAALAYASGATMACVAAVRNRDTSDLPPALLVRVERNLMRYGWYVARTAFGGDLYRDGREAWLATADGGLIRAQDSMANSWRAARPQLDALVGPGDLTDADRLVNGQAALPIERDEADLEHDLAPPMKPDVPFGAAVAPDPRPSIELAPVLLTWELVVFLVANGGRRRSAFASIPGRMLGGFLSALGSGDLDQPIGDWLDSRHPLRRLLTHQDAKAPGLFDELGLRVSLLAPERDYWGQPMRLTLLRPLPRSFARRLAA